MERFDMLHSPVIPSERVPPVCFTSVPARLHRQVALSPGDYEFLLHRFGPSLGLWRAAEVAALREQWAHLVPPILDLGCGDGLVSSLVLPSIEIGLDPDPRALGRAGKLGLYRQLECVRAENCALPEGSLATIVSNSVLEHLPAVDSVLDSCARLLRPGGRLIFTAPTESFAHWLALPHARYAAWRNRQLAHLNLWPVATWTEHLARAGFEIEKVRSYLRHSLVATWDLLELCQQPRMGRFRLFGCCWRRLPPTVVRGPARAAARLDLSASPAGGGRLVVARKR
jgi:SAM-dependent methyltransferase